MIHGRNLGRKSNGFTLIELLTVIAIISVLAALLFPVAGTVREQGRATDCMSKLHQLYIAANMYKLDEGSYPPSLLGYVEVDNGLGYSTGNYMYLAAQTPVRADRTLHGIMYPAQIKDIGTYRCPDSTNMKLNTVTIAHIPPRPAKWPLTPGPPNPDPRIPYPYITDASSDPSSVAANCASDSFGYHDCWLDGPLKGFDKLYYTYDCFDIGPRIDSAGKAVKDAGGNLVYDKHYSTDWTGWPKQAYPPATWPYPWSGAVLDTNPGAGETDLPNQLRYSSPPNDKTVLTYCTWHTTTNGAPTFTSISLSGTAKKLDAKEVVAYGANYYNR